MKRAALIVNPFATGVTGERTAAVAEILRSVGELTVLPTERRAHATELAGEALGEVDALFVFGGDGVFNEVLNAANGEVPVGLVPGGGANVLPRALGLPRDPADAARHVAEAARSGRARRISLGRVNGRRFAFSAGVGFDAELVRRVDALGRRADGRRPGGLAFATQAVRLLVARHGRLEPALEVVRLGRAAFALVANADPYTYAGPVALHVAPAARFELGVDVVAPVELTAARIPRLLAYAVRGRGQERARDVLYAHDLDELEVRCDGPLPLQADGEDLGDVDHAVFEAERDAVAVLV